MTHYREIETILEINYSGSGGGNAALFITTKTGCFSHNSHPVVRFQFETF